MLSLGLLTIFLVSQDMKLKRQERNYTNMVIGWDGKIRVTILLIITSILFSVIISQHLVYFASLVSRSLLEASAKKIIISRTIL